MILRLPLQVRLFDLQGNLIQTVNSTKKSQVRLRLEGLPRAQWAYGTCRVWYNKAEHYWNEFTFTSLAQLDTGLILNTEKPLIDFLKSVIPARYLETRQLSPAQRRVLADARKKSPLGAGL